MHWLILLLAPPIVFALPWIVALYRRQYGKTLAILLGWVVAWGVLLKLWFGVGVALIVGLGLLVVFTTRIKLDPA